jgi:hypothetical protein
MLGANPCPPPFPRKNAHYLSKNYSWIKEFLLEDMAKLSGMRRRLIKTKKEKEK